MAKRSNNAVHIVSNDAEQPSRQHQPLKIKLDHMKTFDPLTNNQKKFYDAYKRGDYFVALHGVAGTGKSFIAVYKALEEVLDKSNPFDKVIIVRSAVQSRDIGHLPGDIEGKLDIYQQPYRQICETLFGRKDAYSRLEEQGVIEFISTSFIRGMTFDDAIIIVDEMQNMTYEEIDTVMTRVGHRSKIIWCGDYRQCDLKKRDDKTGLQKFFDVAGLMSAFTKIEFTTDDIVRSSLVKDYILAKIQLEDKNAEKDVRNTRTSGN
jgi:phosphate starvation-inducible protein PhoH and related proteins